MGEKFRINKKVNSIIREKARTSYIGEDDFVSLVKGGVSIHYHLKQSGLDIENIYRAVKRSQKIVKDRFGYDLENLAVFIYSTKEEMREEGRSRSRYASWIAGIFDGKIRIIAEKDDDAPEALYIILTHEIVHLALYEICRGQCPYWLDEGMAIFLSQELPDEYMEILIQAIKEDKTFPLETLQRPLPGGLDKNPRKLAYAQMMSIVDYLVQTRGWDVVKNMILQCSRREINAILSDLSLNYYLIEQDWKRWRRGRDA